MGAWGAGIFENDGASDFVWEVEAAPAILTLMRPIDAIVALVKSGDYLEMPLCEEAAAAAEMLAALRNGDLDVISAYSTDGRIAKYNLVTLIDDIIRLSQLDEGDAMPTEPVDLLAVSQEAAENLQDAAAARGVTIGVTGQPSVIPGV